MAITNVLRNKAFWALDKLKGNSLKNDIEDIKSCFDLSSFELLQKRNEPILNKLLSEAVCNTAYYQSYKGFKHLSDFPVVNKLIIKNNFEEINIKQKNSSKASSVSTSGSTGTPFKIYQTKRKKTRNTADTIYFANSAGFTIGDKLLYLRLWAAYYKKNWILAKLQNVDQLDVEDLKDDYINKLISRLQKDNSPKGWLGYPSAYEKLCNYLDKTNSNPLNCNIKSIISMSEPLSESVASKMEYYFQNPVVSRYSNVENGIIAQQIPKTDYFTINWASYIIEILDMEKDIPAKQGEIGRIVLTDLYNLATPMIRYDTGDVGSFIIEQNLNNGFPMFKSVAGRITDILRNTDGEIVNPFIIYNNLYRYPELDQIQLIQISNRTYTFRINCTGTFVREKEFLNFFKGFLGQDAIVTAEYVNEIPLLKSGKRKIIVNLTK